MSEGIQMPLQQVADILAAELVGGGLNGALNGAGNGSTTIHGVSSDTRTIEPGALFVALSGPNFDGHDHLDAAQAAGAAAALVSKPPKAGHTTTLPCVLVDDTLNALGQLAAAWRRQCALPTVAITGSNGKTSVKEMLATILGAAGPTLYTHGNLNNHIGLPLTLLRISPEHRYAVVEMGANHPGEIAALTAIAAPDVAIVNNAGPAHLEGFGDVAGVARAKAEIWQGLGSNGVAIFNADDTHAPLWRELSAGHQQLGFGIDAAQADVRATDIDGQHFTLRTPLGSATVNLPLPGRHNILNALAAAAAATALGIDITDIAAGLQQVKPVSGRLKISSAINGSTLIDDSYNANPASLDAALAVLQQRPGLHILVLGDLAELGPDAEQIHQRIGQQARTHGVDALYASGPLSHHSVVAFGDDGHHFDDINTLVTALRPRLSTEVSVLIKGSRSAGMERVSEALMASPTDRTTNHSPSAAMEH